MEGCFEQPTTAKHADKWVNCQVLQVIRKTDFSSNDWALAGSVKLMQTRARKHTYVNTRRVCCESVDGGGLETVQCAAQL